MIFIFHRSGLNIFSTLLSDLMHHPRPSDALLTQEMLWAEWAHAKDFIFLTLSPLVAACSIVSPNILHVYKSSEILVKYCTVHIFSAVPMCDRCNSTQTYVRGLYAVWMLSCLALLLLRYAAAVGRLPARSAVPSALRSNPPPARGSCTRSFT